MLTAAALMLFGAFSTPVKAIAQEAVPEPESVAMSADEMPTVVGGLAVLMDRIKYPEIARKAGIEGTVLLDVVVDTNGAVADVTVKNGIGGGCDEEAVRAAKTLHFTPGYTDGKPVRMKIVLPIRFVLPPPPHGEEVVKVQEPEIYQVVEHMPTFEGCPDPDPAAQMVCLNRLGSKIKYPEIARKAGVQGVVHVSFVVDEYGNVVNPTVARGIGADCDQEALRVISEAKFTPGRQDGEAVKVQMSIPIQFSLR